MARISTYELPLMMFCAFVGVSTFPPVAIWNTSTSAIHTSTGVPVSSCYAACASGATAMEIARTRILAGLCEVAVVVGAEAAGVGTDEAAEGWQPVRELPFEPVRGFHAVLGMARTGQVISVKGAPEITLPRCVSRRAGGVVQPMTAQAREEIGNYRYAPLATLDLPAQSETELWDLTAPFREDADLVMGPTHKHRWAYACSKAIDEFLALAYYKEKKLPVIACGTGTMTTAMTLYEVTGRITTAAP